MRKTDVISVVVPVYNTASYLRQCLASIASQTYRDLEIICIDDGSTDGSGEICDAFAEQDARFVVRHQANAGESAARNAGMALARGEYLAFVDCDDWLAPEMYEKLLHHMQQTQVDIVGCSYVKEFEDGTSRRIENAAPTKAGIWQQHDLLTYVYHRDAYRGVTGYIWCKLYRTAALRRHGRLPAFRRDLVLGGDILFFAQAAMRAETSAYLDEALYHYRIRRDSGYHEQDERKWWQMVVTYERLCRYLHFCGVSEEILRWVRRFLAYRAEVVAKMAQANGNLEIRKRAQDVMRRERDIYCQMNEDHPERIVEYEEILQWGQGE
ncbi:glycosyltransferase [uncultured Selenomonas sp.]|uniref:glycosyltransferase family 2 protein n=1 Tax=uncultured Selenomonas sp. TaxID=159275 RepID=UPI0025D86DE5|nr:glycosyltransferase [uncultured Selenomonas sp.]